MGKLTLTSGVLKLKEFRAMCTCKGVLIAVPGKKRKGFNVIFFLGVLDVTLSDSMFYHWGYMLADCLLLNLCVSFVIASAWCSI